MGKKIRLMPSGKVVEAREGETILSTLERSGYALPNNCRAGACGECKSKILKGDIDQGFVLHMALPEEERAEGYALTCMAKPLSDMLEIQYDAAEGQPKLFPPRENQFYIVMEKGLVTKRIVKIRLRALGDPMRFWPGQYVTLGGEDGIPKRCYSIANIFNNDGDLILLVTRLKDGKMSNWLHDTLQEGDKIKLSGPYGTFVGDPGAKTPVLCLAAGSGLAPILSLASAALMRGGFSNPASVLFSARTKDDLFEMGHLAFLQNKFRNFDFRYTLTQEEGAGELYGRIPDILPTLYKDLSGHSVFISGSPSFVEDCVSVVQDLGGKDKLIHLEKFSEQN